MNKSTILSTLYLGLIDEQFFPEILYYDWNSLNFFKEIITYQNDLVNKVSQILKFTYTSKLLKEVEIFRMLSIFRSYHRNRIWKIENFFSLEFNSKKFISRISKSEEYFSFSYKNLIFSHQNIMLYDFIFKNINSYRLSFKKYKTINRKIQKEDFIFFRLFLKKNFEFRFYSNSKFYTKLITDLIFCMKYNSIKHLVFSKALCLV